MQKNIIVIVTLLIVFFVNTGCPKPCIEANYSFAVNSQIVTDLDSIRVGDSIFLYSSFPVKLTDQVTGANVDYTNSAEIVSTVGIVKLIYGTFPGSDAVTLVSGSFLK